MSRGQSNKGILNVARDHVLSLGNRFKTHEIANATRRHIANARLAVKDWLQNDTAELEEFRDKAKCLCESPIETLLLTELLQLDFSLGVWGATRPIALANRADLKRLRKRLPSNLKYVLIFPQAWIQRFRVDFLVEFGVLGALKRVAIECDGRQYHENPGKFSSDRERDRILNIKRIPVLRFTGKELNIDPSGCAEIVKKYVLHHSQFR